MSKSTAMVAHVIDLPERTWEVLCDALLAYIERRGTGATIKSDVYAGKGRLANRSVRPHYFHWGIPLHSVRAVWRKLFNAERVTAGGKVRRRTEISGARTRATLCALQCALGMVDHFNRPGGAAMRKLVYRQLPPLRRWHGLSPLEKLALQVDD